MPTLNQAIEAHKNGHLEQARSYYEAVLAKNGGGSCAYRYFGHLLRELGEVEQALNAFWNASKNNSRRNEESGNAENHQGLFLTDTGIAAELAGLLFEGGNRAESRIYAEQAIRDDPGDSMAYEILIKILGLERNIDAALELYDQAPISVRSSFYVSKAMAIFLALSSRFEESLKVRNNGLQIPQDSLRRIKGYTRIPLTSGYMVAHLGGPIHAGVERLDLSVADGPSPTYLRLEEATVLSGEWFIIDRDLNVFRDVNHGTPTGDPTPYYQHPGNSIRDFKKQAILPEPANEKFDKAILVGGDPNYFHWIVEFVPRLMAVAKTPGLDDYPILVHEKILDYQRQWLALAGIDEDRLITLDYPGCYPCGELIVPLFPPAPMQTALPRARHQAVAWLRTLVNPVEDGTRRIYISRRDSRRRQVANEDILIAALEQEGFEILELSPLSESQKIEIFSRAKIVVACHGAGLANMAFAPSCCRLIEILDPGWNTQDFKNLAKVRGQRYDAVMCRTYFEKRSLPIFTDSYITDQTIDRVLRLIREIPGVG